MKKDIFKWELIIDYSGLGKGMKKLRRKIFWLKIKRWIKSLNPFLIKFQNNKQQRLKNILIPPSVIHNFSVLAAANLGIEDAINASMIWGKQLYNLKTMKKMEMPIPCKSCGNIFELNDGRESKKWYPHTIICETCSGLERDEIERDDEIEDLENQISDAEFSIIAATKRLIELGIKSPSVNNIFAMNAVDYEGSKMILKLDKNFHIYIHGNKQLIKQGEDAEGKFLLIRYNEIQS